MRRQAETDFLRSIQALSMEDLIAMAHHVTSSRVLDAVVDSPQVPPKAKRKLILTFMGHFHELVDDRIGSRVGDRFWAYADPYFKVRAPLAASCALRCSDSISAAQEKIARSVIPHQHFLIGSAYGKYFARNLNLHLLQRNPEEWKNAQAATKLPPPSASIERSTKPAAVQPSQPPNKQDMADPDSRSERPKKKRKARPEDEIDELFNAAPKKKFNKAMPPVQVKDAAQPQNLVEQVSVDDKELLDVMGAIRAAPKVDKEHRKKKQKK